MRRRTPGSPFVSAATGPLRWHTDGVFALVVRFDLHDTAAAVAFDALVAEVLPQITALEPGTLVYATHTVEDEPLARVFYEVYTDRDAHRAHEAAPHTARFLAAKDRYVASARVDFLTSPIGKGGALSG